MTSTTPVAAVEDQFAVLRSRQFLRLELVMAVLATVTASWLYVTEGDSALGLIVVGAFASTVVAMVWCLRRLTVENVVPTVMVYLVVLWTSTIVIAPLIPFGLPVMSFPMFIPLLVAAPLLERRQLVWLMAAGALAMALVAALALRSESAVTDPLSEWTMDAIVISTFALRAVTMSLAAWDANARRDATLVAAAQARDAIRDSRARLVEAGDEQRRRLERDLHDGAQQRLVALSMRLRLLADRHPEVGDDVAQLVDELQAGLAELREVAHGIYPPLLERGGLPEAVRAAGRRVPLPTEVHADGIARHPQTVETAVYYCCLEALQNAAKHAGDDATVVIDLREGADALTVAITDDGDGFDSTIGPTGRGLQNMADRLAAIGADLEVDSAPGAGTTIRARVPLVDDASR